MITPTRHRSAAALLALGALLAAGCGSDTTDSAASDASSPATSVSEESPDSMPATTAADTVDTESTGDASPAAQDDEPAGAFPITIEHKYGATTVDAEPQRVVTVGYAEHDGVLALGVVPVGVRDWYGDQPSATWPWAQDELGGATPEIVGMSELDYEQIAALDPDVILGIASGMPEEEYEILSQIAPTIAQPGEYNDYGTPWREQFELIGSVLGRSDEAAAVLAGLDERFADERAAHPEFEGVTAAVAFTWQDLPGAYASSDPRSQVLTDLGFQIPEEFDELAGDSFYFNISAEELPTLDSGVIVWVLSDQAGYDAVDAMSLRPTLTAYAEGREVIADPILSGAFSHSSPLSLEYVLDHLVPELVLAVDGDPSTMVPSMAPLLGDGGAMSADEQAAADAWSVVFDSTSAFDDVAQHLDGAAELQGTLEAYAATGDSMGGISLAPTSVFVDGAEALVTYDVLFGGSAAYTALEGSISLVDDVWTVGRDEFCTFMALARNACPA